MYHPSDGFFCAFFSWEYGNHLCTHPSLTVRSTLYLRGAVGPEWKWPPVPPPFQWKSGKRQQHKGPDGKVGGCFIHQAGSVGLPAFAGNNILSCNSSLPLVLTSPSWSEHTVKPAAAPGRQPELADAPALNSQNWVPAKTQCPAKNTNCNYLKNHSSFVRPQREDPC